MKCMISLDPAVQSIAISSAFLVLLPTAWLSVRRAAVKVGPGFLANAKFVTGGGLVVVTVAYLVALLAQSSHAPSIVAIAFSLAAVIGVALLSSVYHQRSLTSSSLLVLYLLVSGCWNLSAVLEVMAAHRLHPLMFFLPVTGAIQLTLLVLECTSKQDIFLPQYKALAPVETANLFSAVSFWWMQCVQ